MAKKRTGQDLTPLEARFVNEIAKGVDQTQAAINAGYSKKTAKNKASNLMRKKEVVAAIQKNTETAMRIAQVDAAEVLDAIKRIANSDVRDLFDERWQVRPPDKLPERIAKAIVGVKVINNVVTGTVTYEYKLESRLRANELLATIGKLIKEGPGGGSDIKTVADLVKFAAGLGKQAAEAQAAKPKDAKVIDV